MRQDSIPFKAQSAGQCEDTGMLGKIQAPDTKKYFGLILSMIEAKTSLKIGDIVLCEVSLNRLEIRRHHSATHILQAALRNVLGAHIAQAGSSVEADKLRFDFSHPKPVTKEELEKIENFVNEAILKGAPAKIEIMDIQNAKKSGAIALFGEKYADKVRVLTLGPSKELCGGTHVENLNEIGSFFIVRESGVSAGVRRIEAVCSKAALELSKEFRKEINDIKDSLKGADPLLSIKKLKDEIKSLQNDLKNASNTKDLNVKDINGVKVVVSKFDEI